MNTRMNIKSRRQGSVAPAAEILLEEMTIPNRDPVGGRIHKDFLSDDVEVIIPRAQDMRRQDSLELYRNGEPFGAKYRLADLGFDDNTVTAFSIPFKMADFPPLGADVTYTMDYRVFDPISNRGNLSLRPISLRFDRLAPGGDNLPGIFFTGEQLRGITEADMEGDLLKVKIDPYHDGEAEDKVELWVSNVDAEDERFYLTPAFDVADPVNILDVHFTREQLTAFGGSGKLYFGYRVTDWSGNVSSLSSTTEIPVYLDQPGLAAAVVPAAAKGLITYNDATPFIEVEIPTYTVGTPAAGDLITLTWEGDTFPYILQSADLDKDPLTIIRVPYATVAKRPLGQTTINYSLRRGSEPVVPSPDTIVNINLESPGGPDPDPDPETPVHELIRPAVLTCGSSPPNTILPEDFGKAASVKISRARVGDNQPIWKIGDSIQLTYDTISAPIVPTVITTANEGSDISIEVPFADVIEAVGTGTPKIFFVITRELDLPGGGTTPVTARSPDQEVVVSAGSELPGGTTPLQLGSFPEAVDYEDEHTGGVYRVIQFDVGRRDTMFRIPLAGVANIEIGRNPRLSYFFEGFNTGNDVKPPEKPWTPLPGTRLEASNVPLTQADLDQGYYEVPLLYRTLLQRICRNGAELNYSLINDLEIPVRAPVAYVYIALNDGGGQCLLSFAVDTQMTSSSFGAGVQTALREVSKTSRMNGPLQPLSIPGRDADTGIVPVEYLKNDLVVQITKADVMTPAHELRLLRDFEGYGRPYRLTTEELNDPEVVQFELNIEQKDFPREGADETFTLDYELFDTVTQTGVVANLPVSVRLDRRAPGGNALSALGFTPEQVRNGIRDTDLVNDRLAVNVHAYLYGEQGDKIELWLGSSADEGLGEYLGVSRVVDDPRATQVVYFTRAQLSNGLRYFGYRVQDQAGNYSVLSRLMDIEVDITPAR